MQKFCLYLHYENIGKSCPKDSQAKPKDSQAIFAQAEFWCKPRVKQAKPNAPSVGSRKRSF